MRSISCQEILEERSKGGRIAAEEGIALLKCDLLDLGVAARELTPRVIPDAVTFVIDRNISYTNVCITGCDFCGFHCRPGAPGAYILSREEVLRKVGELVELGGTQVLIQGGIHPDLGLDYYLDMVCAIHEKYPQIHIHSFSALEFDVLAKKTGISLPELFRIFRQAGLNSLPGGGAEILVERVRERISPRKISSDRWLEVMEVAHNTGLKTTATMVFGLGETLEERITHLVRLRDLQDRTGGFRSFIPWSFMPFKKERKKTQCGESFFLECFAGGDDYLRTVAVSRLMLDNFEHIQSGWLTEGMKLGQIALAFGCDDMGGTLIEDKVLEPSGIKVTTRKNDLIRLIVDAGFVPVQRNTNYEIVKVFR